MHKIKVYIRLIVTALVLLVFFMFIASNRDVVTVKFLSWTIWQAPLYLFIVVVAVLGVVIFWIMRKIRKIVVDFRQLRKEEKARKKLVDDAQNKQ